MPEMKQFYTMPLIQIRSKRYDFGKPFEPKRLLNSILAVVNDRHSTCANQVSGSAEIQNPVNMPTNTRQFVMNKIGRQIEREATRESERGRLAPLLAQANFACACRFDLYFIIARFCYTRTASSISFCFALLNNK